MPATVTIYGGGQFDSLLNKLTLLEIKRHRTTTCHRASNGTVEHLHRGVMTSLQAEAGLSWIDNILVVLGLPSSPERDRCCSCAKLVCVRNIHAVW